MPLPHETKIGTLKVKDSSGKATETSIETAGEYSRCIEFDPPLGMVTRHALPRLMQLLAKAGQVAEREDTKL